MSLRLGTSCLPCRGPCFVMRSVCGQPNHAAVRELVDHPELLLDRDRAAAAGPDESRQQHDEVVAHRFVLGFGVPNLAESLVELAKELTDPVVAVVAATLDLARQKGRELDLGIENLIDDAIDHLGALAVVGIAPLPYDGEILGSRCHAAASSRKRSKR